MAVYRLFRNQAFEPEALSTMSNAYADVCRALGLSDRAPPHAGARTVVAKMVIEFAQRGARDRALLRDCVLQALRSRAADHGRAARHAGL